MTEPMANPDAPAGVPKPERQHLRVYLAALVGLLAVGGFAAWYFLIREPEPRDDMERFQGAWQISIAGRDTPVVVQVKAEHWLSVANAVEGKAYRLTVNESVNPKEIDLEPVDTAGLIGPTPRLHGIYAFENNRKVRVALNPGVLPRPTTFEGADAVVWMLTRVKLEESDKR
jgi:uncharacterized protein (TIGR03067 family)